MQITPILFALALTITGTEAVGAALPDPDRLDQIPNLTSTQKQCLHRLYADWDHQLQPITTERARIERRIRCVSKNLDRARRSPLTLAEDLALNGTDSHVFDHRFDSLWRERYTLLAVENKLEQSLEQAATDFWQEAKLFLHGNQIDFVEHLQLGEPRK